MYNFFAYLSRMKNIKRWGLMRNTQEENIKEHSFDVAVIAHALVLIENKIFGKNIDENIVMKLALFHEAGEVFTGDIATPIKYFSPELKNALLLVEENCLEKLILMLPEELQEEYASLIFHDEAEEYIYVKAADRICAYIKCMEELRSGNHEFEKAANNIKSSIDAIDLDSVRYFMEKCMPGYSLSLDELNE
ncbi:MAG: 5'-deoxynucleotidase [Christensenellaceae bacterium]|nr:5'-deoxynucleotidase [Christensenellaceae bacterium]